LSGIVNDSCQEQTDGDSKLVGSDNDTTDPLGRSLGLVHGDCQVLVKVGCIVVADLRVNLLIAETRPTPSPAKKRPAMNKGWLVETVCKITPKLKTNPIADMRPILRPRISAHGAARSAPKNVPADRMDTIRESSLAVSFPSACVAKVCFQYFMPRIPEMVPVSYPNRTPPKATKKPMQIAGLCASVSQ
jgi:hypothetical protein